MALLGPQGGMQTVPTDFAHVLEDHSIHAPALAIANVDTAKKARQDMLATLRFIREAKERRACPVDTVPSEVWHLLCFLNYSAVAATRAVADHLQQSVELPAFESSAQMIPHARRSGFAQPGTDVIHCSSLVDLEREPRRMRFFTMMMFELHLRVGRTNFTLLAWHRSEAARIGKPGSESKIGMKAVRVTHILHQLGHCNHSGLL